MPELPATGHDVERAPELPATAREPAAGDHEPDPPDAPELPPEALAPAAERPAAGSTTVPPVPAVANASCPDEPARLHGDEALALLVPELGPDILSDASAAGAGEPADEAVGIVDVL